MLQQTQVHAGCDTDFQLAGKARLYGRQQAIGARKTAFSQSVQCHAMSQPADIDPRIDIGGTVKRFLLQQFLPVGLLVAMLLGYDNVTTTFAHTGLNQSIK